MKHKFFLTIIFLLLFNNIFSQEERIMKVKSYLPNDYGLFDMAGNVAEWTSTAYNRSSTSLLLDFNPDYINISKGNKVVRGGSWKDIGFFLQNSVSTYEQQDKPRYRQAGSIGVRRSQPGKSATLPPRPLVIW